jgi:NADH:ubiquinone oxidoreductase subunit 5 (subunit L)/multisubunit Na+/H+ antiporter MnhA subunit
MPNHFLSAFILIPAIGFLLSLVIPKKNENAIAWTVFAAVLVNFVIAVCYDVLWIYQGRNVIDERDLLLYHSEHYEFFIDFYWDKISLVFFTVGTFLVLLVARYSQYYMHREPGYKRFFNTLLFFYLGYSVAVLSGNIETLFVGWEFLGVSSFLLIACQSVFHLSHWRYRDYPGYVVEPSYVESKCNVCSTFRRVGSK